MFIRLLHSTLGTNSYAKGLKGRRINDVPMISAKLRALHKMIHTAASLWDSLHKVPKKLL